MKTTLVLLTAPALLARGLRIVRSDGSMAAEEDVKSVKQSGQEEDEAKSMRSDDYVSEEAALHCVDCPRYVALTAYQKSMVLWTRITSDEYRVPFHTRCAGELGTCVCDGKVRYGAIDRWTAWKPVRDTIKCTTAAFGEDPLPWRRKECWCEHEFPMSWIGLLQRNLQDQQGRVNNGTMPMFFDRFSDENPPNAAKVIHTFGSTALVRFVPAANTGFTGMFAKGAEFGVLRFSIVADWTKPCKGGTDLNFDGCLKPSLGFKMLRDGDYSSNTVAQINLGDGVGWNFDFFNFAHSTYLPMPTGLGAMLVKNLFKAAAAEEEINGNGNEELATDGAKARQPRSQIRAPKAMFFVPAREVRGRFSNNVHDVRHDFKQLAAGTKLYDLFSVDFSNPACSADGQPVVWTELGGSCPKTFLGYVESTTRFVASAYQDHRLFFQHERLKTKGGSWARKKCVSSSGSLGPLSEFRMAGEPGATCTQVCPEGTTAASSGTCPFKELE